MIEHIEGFHAQLQEHSAITADGEVLENRQILVVDAGVAKIEARLGSLVANARHGERACIDSAAILRRTSHQKARGLTGQIARRVRSEKAGTGILASDA